MKVAKNYTLKKKINFDMKNWTFIAFQQKIKASQGSNQQKIEV